ncbi:MAG: tape measure protein [Dietzia sp.]
MAELGVGYLSIIPETSKIAPGIKSALGSAEQHAEPSGKSMGSRIAGGIGTAVSTGLKTVAGGAVAAGVAGIGTAMVKGFQRLDAIDQANAKLTGLGHSAGSVKGIMDDSLASVKGTAFGLGEAASLAAGAVASGIKPGQELQRVLSLTGDAATIAGTSMGEMGQIFNKVAATNKVQGDVLNQLGERGIPIIQMLAAEMGVTAEEAVKMASQGKIGFETFANAMESQLGGAALEGANTFRGALANLGAAAGRLGAEILGPGFSAAPGLIRRATEAVDDLTAKAGPAADRVAGLVSSFDFGTAASSATQFFNSLASTVTSSGLLSGLGSVATSVGAVASAAASASPAIGSIAGSLAEVGTSLGVSGLSLLATTLDGVAAVTSGVLAPALSTVAGLMESQPGLVTTAVLAWGAFKTVPSIVSKVQQATSPATGALRGMASANGALIESSAMGTVQMGRFGSAISDLGKKSPVIGQMQTSFVNAAVGADRFGRTAGAASAAMTGLKAGGMGLVNMLGGPLNTGLIVATVGIAALAAASETAKRQQDALRESSERLAKSQRDVTEALIESSGEMSSDVWSALEGQIDGVRTSLDSVAATGPGFMGWMGTASKSAAKFYGALRTSNIGLAENAVATVQAAREQSRLASESGKTAEVIDALGLTSEQLASRVYGSGTAWSHLRSQIDSTTEGGEQAVAYLAGLRSEFEMQQTVVEMIGPQYFELQGALGVLGDAAASADDKLSAMRTTLEILGELDTSAAERTAAVAESVSKLGDVLSNTSVEADEYGRAFQNADGSLEAMNTNTKALRDATSDLTDKLISVAVGGGDVHEAFAALQPEMEAARVKAEEMGIDWERFIATTALTPSGIDIIARTHGLDEAEQDLISIHAALKDAEVGAEVPVRLLGGQDSIEEIERLGGKVRWINEEEGTAFVTVESQEFLDKMGDTQGLLDAFDEASPMASLLLDGTQAERGIADIMEDLGILNDENPSPEVSLILDEFEQNRDISHRDLDELRDRVVDPKARLLIDELLAQSARANADLDNTARPRSVQITPFIATGSLGALQAQINSIRFTAPVTATLSDAVGGRAMGGRIPRNADGGRLPKTGPGTDRTDGILGVSSDTGTPTSFVDAGEWVVNRESSEKYNGVLAAINRDDPRVRGLQALAAGGRVGMASKQDLLDLAWGRSGEGPPLEGSPYVYGGRKWGDCSSAQYAFSAKLSGLLPFGSRFSTSTMATELAAMGFTMGSLGGENDYNVGWYGHGTGGHTVGAIGRTNVEMGGGYGGGKIGGTASPWESIYTQKAHKPMGALYGISGITAHMDGAEGYPGGGYSGGGRSGYESGSEVDRGDAPRTWGDVAGLTAKSFAQGYTTDLLSILGLSDDLPPALKAAQEWKASERAQAERAAKQAADRAGGQGPKALDEVAAQRQANALLDKEESLRKAREAVAQAKAGDSKGVVDPGKVRDAEGRAAKAERDLELAKMQASQSRVTSQTPSSSPSAEPTVRRYSSTGGGDRDVGDPGGVPPGGWGDMVAHALSYAGQRDTMQDAVLDRINSISGGDPDFVSRAPWADALAQHNSGQGIDQALAEATARGVFTALEQGAAMGLMGVTATGFSHYRDSELPDDEFHPMSNVVAKINEAIDVHGSLEKAWANAPGFWNGGTARHSRDVFPAWLADGEEVTRTADAERGGNRDILQAMRSGATFDADGSGGGQHTHFHVVDVDEALRRKALDDFERGLASTGGGPLW